jgi:peptidyl-prolyl cis-trans isomerase C
VPLALALAASACSSPDYVAKVGDHPISLSDFQARARVLVQSGYRGLDTLRQEDRAKLLDGIVAQELVVMDGLARGLDRDTIISEEVEHARTRALMERLYQERVTSRQTDPSEEELRRAFTQDGYDREVLTQQIVCANLNDAQQALAGLERGEDFAAMVARYSIRGARERFGAVGDIGWVKIADMLEGLKGPVMSVPVGSLCPEPVQTDLGYNVFKVNGRRDVDFATVRPVLIKILRREATGQARMAYVDSLRQRYRMSTDGAGIAALRLISPDQKELSGDDYALVTWDGGRLNARDYLAKHRAGRVKHPSSLDSIGLVKAADNLAGQRVMAAEATRLGYDQDPAVRAEWQKKQSELLSRWLFGLEGRAKAAKPDEQQVRAYYDGHIAQYTRADGKVTPYEQVQAGIRRLLQQVNENRAMDAYLVRLREQYRDQVDIQARMLEKAFVAR